MKARAAKRAAEGCYAQWKSIKLDVYYWLTDMSPHQHNHSKAPTTLYKVAKPHMHNTHRYTAASREKNEDKSSKACGGGVLCAMEVHCTRSADILFACMTGKILLLEELCYLFTL